MSSAEKKPLLLSGPINNDSSYGSRGYSPITEDEPTKSPSGGKGNLATSIFNLANAGF